MANPRTGPEKPALKAGKLIGGVKNCAPVAHASAADFDMAFALASLIQPMSGTLRPRIENPIMAGRTAGRQGQRMFCPVGR